VKAVPPCLAAILVALAAASAAGGAEEQVITLLHTSDVHGHVLAFDDAAGRPVDGSLAQVATLVAAIRAGADHPVLLLDSGDTIQGTPLEELAHVSWGMPSPTIAAMNGMGYAAMAIGNHEFNFGLEVLRRARDQAAFPFLSANTVLEGSDEPAFQPYAVIETGGVRVGLLGLTTTRIPGWELPEHYPGLEFLPLEETARRWVPVLRGEERCDLVVVLAHIGLEGVEGGALKLTRVPGVDVVLTGHAHRDLAPREVNGVIVSQPASWGRRLTRVDLRLERQAGGWKVAGWSGENLQVDGVPGDQIVIRGASEAHRRVTEALGVKIARVTGRVDVQDCRLRDCAALDLIHAAQLEASGADLSLASLLSATTPALEPGPVPLGWVHALYVYPNTLVVVRLTGTQVKDVLEHAARYYQGLECSGDGCTVIIDPQVAFYNVDTVAGLTYRIDPSRPPGERVRDLRYDGQALDLNARFTLVCNNYRRAGGGGYPHLGQAEEVWRGGENVKDLIADHLRQRSPWTPRVDQNWVVAPDLVGRRPLSETERVDRVVP